MPTKQKDKFAKIVLITFGFLLLFMGITTFIYPQIMTRYGLVAETLHARLTISALIGGSEIGLGTYMLLGSKIRASISARLYTALSIFCGIAVARLTSIIFAQAQIPDMIYRELLAESLIIILLFWALVIQRQS